MRRVWYALLVVLSVCVVSCVPGDVETALTATPAQTGFPTVAPQATATPLPSPTSTRDPNENVRMVCYPAELLVGQEVHCVVDGVEADPSATWNFGDNKTATGGDEQYHRYSAEHIGINTIVFRNQLGQMAEFSVVVHAVPTATLWNTPTSVPSSTPTPTLTPEATSTPAPTNTSTVAPTQVPATAAPLPTATAATGALVITAPIAGETYDNGQVIGFYWEWRGPIPEGDLVYDVVIESKHLSDAAWTLCPHVEDGSGVTHGRGSTREFSWQYDPLDCGTRRQNRVRVDVWCGSQMIAQSETVEFLYVNYPR